MDRRTYEGPMEWEYQDRGPLDATSPFSHVGRSQGPQVGPASPSKFGGRPNPFANSPSKPLSSLPPQTSLFSPRLQHTHTAPPFRNPAFTTPRKPFDETPFSEAESSPALTETSDVPNDTPDLDRFGDANMGGTITPSKVDKNLRYAKIGHQSRKHASGKGEIARTSRDHQALRKRKRGVGDRDVGSLRYHSSRDDSEFDSEDYASDQPTHTVKGKNSRKQSKSGKGWFMTMFDLVNQHPNMPDNLSRWVTLMVNVSVVSVFGYMAWSLWSTIRNDILTANDAARREIINKALECNDQYLLNECEKKDRPALKAMCDEWDECRIQDPESIMVVKNTAKQMAVVINEFASTMELRGYIFLFGILFLCLGLNHWNSTPGSSHSNSAQTVPPTPAPATGGSHPQPSGFPDASTAQAYMWVPVQTPSHRRHLDYDNDGTDTDGASPPLRKAILPPQTPSRRFSPTKGQRAMSPVKAGRSPSKGY